MENGHVTEISAQTSQELDDALDVLRADARFEELREQLESGGYAEADATVTKHPDGTFEVNVSYASAINSTATDAHITARIINATAHDVRLINSDPDLAWPLVAAAIAASAVLLCAVYAIYRRRRLRLGEPDKTESPRDYVQESVRMLDEAERVYADGRPKLGYGLVGQALRLALSHDLGADRETSNSELLQLCKTAEFPLDELRDCLDTSSLVVFARRRSSEADFARILDAARRIISVASANSPH